MLLKGQSTLFLQPFMTSRCCSAALQVAIISERGKSGDEASHGEPQGSSSQAAGVLQGGRMVLEQEGPPELLDKEKYCGIGHDKSAPGGMAEIGLTNSSVTNSPITPIPSRRLLTHNCFRKGGIPAEIELVLNCFCKILLPAFPRKIYSQSFEIAKAPNLRHLNCRH